MSNSIINIAPFQIHCLSLISVSPTNFHISFWTKSDRLVTFFLLAPRFSKLRTERELDSIVTWLCSVPVATTLTFTLSDNGEINHPRRASTMKWISSHWILLNLVRVSKTCLTAVYTRRAFRGKSRVVLCIFFSDFDYSTSIQRITASRIKIIAPIIHVTFNFVLSEDSCFC